MEIYIKQTFTLLLYKNKIEMIFFSFKNENNLHITHIFVQSIH